jgi:hypothetical protein
VSRPYTGTVMPYQGPNTSNDYNYGGMGTQELYGQSTPGAGQYSANQQSFYPSPQPVSAMAFQSSAQQSAGQQAVKYPLNRDFSEVLERGSLEDIARLVESTAPRPEVRHTLCCTASCAPALTSVRVVNVLYRTCLRR